MLQKVLDIIHKSFYLNVQINTLKGFSTILELQSWC